MSDLHAYRADAELTGALRDYGDRMRIFRARVTEFDDEHPGHELLWSHGAFAPADDQRAVGFRDGTDDVPQGLSRAKTRVELRPKRSAAGREWQVILDRFNRDRPRVAEVFRRFAIPESVSGGPADNGTGWRIAPVQWGDAGEDGVLVFAYGALDSEPLGGKRKAGLSPHLIPIPLSEFYAIKERLDAEREAAREATS